MLWSFALFSSHTDDIGESRTDQKPHKRRLRGERVRPPDDKFAPSPKAPTISLERPSFLVWGEGLRYVETSPSPVQTSAFAAAYIAWWLALLHSGAISLREFNVEAAHYFSSTSFFCAKTNNSIQFRKYFLKPLFDCFPLSSPAHKGRGHLFQLFLRNFWECYKVGGTHVGRVTCALAEVER